MVDTIAPKLSRLVNATAVQQYPRLARHTGMGGMLLTLAPRLALRMDTPYPYSLVEDDRFYPDSDDGFGRVIQASRQEGLDEIHSTISERDKEHNWLFVPEASVWIDNTMLPQEAGVDADSYLQIFLAHCFPGIERVHTHPDQSIRNIALDNELADSPGAPYSTDNYLLEAAMPSGNDFLGHLQIQHRIPSNTVLTDSVVSHHGVTSFSMNAWGQSCALFATRSYERRILDDPIDPVLAIRTALDVVRNHELLYEGHVPIFKTEFAPAEMAN